MQQPDLGRQVQEAGRIMLKRPGESKVMAKVRGLELELTDHVILPRPQRVGSKGHCYGDVVAGNRRALMSIGNF